MSQVSFGPITLATGGTFTFTSGDPSTAVNGYVNLLKALSELQLLPADADTALGAALKAGQSLVDAEAARHDLLERAVEYVRSRRHEFMQPTEGERRPGPIVLALAASLKLIDQGVDASVAQGIAFRASLIAWDDWTPRTKRELSDCPRESDSSPVGFVGGDRVDRVD